MISITFYNATDHRQRHSQCRRIRIVGGKDWPSTIDSNHVDLNVERVLVPQLSAAELDVEFRIETDGSKASGEPSISLSNHGRTLAFAHGPRVHRVKDLSVTLPLSIRVRDTQIELVAQSVQLDLDNGLTQLNASEYSSGQSKQAIGAPTLAAWLETLGQMQRVAAGSNQLFELATQAVFNPGGMDGCMVVQQKNNEWEIVASHLPYPDHGVHFRPNLVELAAQSKRSYFHDRRYIDESTEFDEAHAAVVCPVLDANQNVVAVVYGFRSLHRRNQRKGIRFLEAQFVQVVTDALSAGMVRLESETRAAQSLARLQQAFPPKIAAQLTTSSDALKPSVREVTVLFCDLRGFSSAAEKAGLDATYDLLADAMDCFSDAVMDLGGTIIDFYGDGLSAFWNAPILQPEHALLACQAAIEIADSIKPLNQRWSSNIGMELGVGVGIHTGFATVGNSGSRSRLKYGPRGTVVNIASRLEQKTKDVETSILVSNTTHRLVSMYYGMKSLGKVELKGLADPIEIFAINESDLGNRKTIDERSSNTQLPCLTEA